MAEGKEKGNGRVTLALLKEQGEDILVRLGKIEEKVDTLHDDAIRIQEFKVKAGYELYHDGKSRMQAVENGVEDAMAEARTAMSWVKVAIVPISLAVVIGIIMLIAH